MLLALVLSPPLGGGLSFAPVLSILAVCMWRRCTSAAPRRWDSSMQIQFANEWGHTSCLSWATLVEAGCLAEGLCMSTATTLSPMRMPRVRRVWPYPAVSADARGTGCTRKSSC